MTKQHNTPWGRRIIGLGAAAVTAALFVLPSTGADPGQGEGERPFRLIEPAEPDGGRVMLSPDPASSPTPLIDPVLVGRA